MNTATLRPSIIRHPSAWDRAELMARTDWIHYFDSVALEEIDLAVKNAKVEKFSTSQITQENFPLPTFNHVLTTISNQLEYGLGIALLRGFPVDRYSREELDLIYVGIGSYIGTPVAQSHEGDTIGVVTDTGKRLGEARGTKTKDPLPFHNDRCDVVGLFCLHKAMTGGNSYVISATTIHNALFSIDPELCASLYEQVYHKRADWEEQSRSLVYSLPVFSSYQGHFACRYLRYFIKIAQELPQTPQLTLLQLKAMDSIDEICRDPRYFASMPFEVGDIQFLNNFVSLHSREGYEDSEKGTQRLLLRLWLSVPNSRPLIDEFSSLYGNTGAGQIRGGALHGNVKEK